jgi:hypothetical protein
MANFARRLVLRHPPAMSCAPRPGTTVDPGDWVRFRRVSVRARPAPALSHLFALFSVASQAAHVRTSRRSKSTVHRHLLALQRELAEGRYQPSPWRLHVIRDPKTRLILVLFAEDRALLLDARAAVGDWLREQSRVASGSQTPGRRTDMDPGHLRLATESIGQESLPAASCAGTFGGACDRGRRQRRRIARCAPSARIGAGSSFPERRHAWPHKKRQSVDTTNKASNNCTTPFMPRQAAQPEC